METSPAANASAFAIEPVPKDLLAAELSKRGVSISEVNYRLSVARSGPLASNSVSWRAAAALVIVCVVQQPGWCSLAIFEFDVVII